MDPQNVIDTIADALRDAPDVHALFLSGSHGTGNADAYSDIDFVLVARDGPTDAIAALWRDAVARTGEIVLWWDRNLRPALINAITRDWTRTDVVILKPDQLGGHRQDSLKVVLDPDGLHATLPATTPPPQPNPARLTYEIEEFIRILGLLPLAVGRREYINGVLGVYHLRNLLVELMIAETAAPFRGGALHLNRLITADQKAVLSDLPPPEPTKDAMIAAHLAYAAAYLPRARKRAAEIGADWPDVFEKATWDALKTTLNIDRPAS